jgi:hypothetical protein
MEDGMAFRLQDLCKTTRHAAANDLPRLFPRFLVNDRLEPRLGIAIRFFETHLGQPRGALDAEALVALFGDPRLARGLIRCLARTYRYCPRPLADVLGTERATALAARGLGTPRDLRALAYARANQEGGFVGPERRADFLTDLVEDIDAKELERVLWLDAADQAVLVRESPIPTASDIRACYNVQVLETLLGSAPQSHFSLCGDPTFVEAVAARHGVQISLKGSTATLYGRPDASGAWTRHGLRVARAALILLAGGVLGPGTVQVQLADQHYEVRLDAPLLSRVFPPRCWSAPASTWHAVDTVMQAIQALRRRGRLAGWRLRWWPEPCVTAQGLLWPELALHRSATSIPLLPLSTAQLTADAGALSTLAERLCFLIVAHPEVPHDLPANLQVVPSSAERLAESLEPDGTDAGREALPGELVALLDAARAAGSLAESDVAWRLDCAQEDVQSRLAPTLHVTSDVVYIDGFGLCTDTLIEHARMLMDEELGNQRGRSTLARLGRRLHGLVGRHEGLHALMAYLSDELQPVA